MRLYKIRDELLEYGHVGFHVVMKTLFPHVDQAGILKYPVMMGHRRLGEPGLVVEIRAGKFALLDEQPENGIPIRVAEGFEHLYPFTGQETVFKAKPARKVVKARPVKAAKDAVA